MRALILSLLSLATLPSTQALAAPKVLTDLPPIHSLASQVMEGVSSPTLLFSPGNSGHGLNLRPSQALAAQEADLIIWVGPAMTPALERPFEVLGSNAQLLTLMALPDVTLIEDGEPHNSHEGHEHGSIDPHAWLDPSNAQLWLTAIAEALATKDPDNAETYRKNAASARDRLEGLEAEIAAKLAPFKNRKYLTTHRAFSYFEARFHLAPAHALTGTDGASAGPRAMQEARRAAEDGTTCLITEPETSAAVLDTLTEGTALKARMIDPLGRDIPSGAAQYERLIEYISETYIDCLK